MPTLDLYDLTQAVVRIVAPQSLALDAADDEGGAGRDLLPLLAPGDLILVSTPGALYSFARLLTKHQYDHIAAVVDDTQALHVGPYKARLLPTARFLTESRTPLVLRPALSDNERTAFVAKLRSFIGLDYNLLQVLELIARLTLERHLGIRLPTSPAGGGERALICSQALMQALAQSSPNLGAYLRDWDRPAADQDAFGSASIHDFVRIHDERPDLLQQVILPEWPKSEGAEAINDAVDADLWSSAAAFIRAALLQLVPEVFRDRFRGALDQLEASTALVSLPIPVATFLYFALLVAVVRRYPLPGVLALLPMLLQHGSSLAPRSSL